MELHTQIPADADSVAHIVEMFDKFLKCHRINDDDRFRVSVCMSEALNNVIEHGYKGDKHKSIDLKCIITDNSINIEVLDEAEWLTDLPVSKPADDMSENGRGWQIIREWTSRIELNRKESGNQLILCLNRT